MEKRTRRKGGGRKPTGREQTPRQICLPDTLWEFVGIMAQRKGLSRSAWIRLAINNQIGSETGIW